MSDPASKAYLVNRVNPILEKLVVELVVKRPENIVIFYLLKNDIFYYFNFKNLYLIYNNLMILCKILELN